MEYSYIRQDSADMRSTARYRRLLAGGGMALVAKSITALSGLISLPLTVHYLGPERFGMWMTVSSLVALIGFADMGLGNGLVSTVAHRYGKGDQAAITMLVSSAFFSLLAVGLVLLLLFALAYPFVPFASLYSVSSAKASAEAGPATLIFVACFCANLPLNVSQRVQMALQEFWLANVWVALGNILGLLGVIAAVHFGAGLSVLTLALYGAPVVVNAIGSIVEFWYRRSFLRPRIGSISLKLLPGLWRTGSAFFLLQLMTMIGLGSDNFIIATMAGAATVTPYAIMSRYAQTTLVVTIFLQPLWPAFGEAMGRGDYAWARHALSRASNLTLSIAVVIAIFTWFFGAQVVRIWVGPGVKLPPGLVIGIGTMILVLCYNGVVATFMNNESLIHEQLRIYFASMLVAIAAKIMLMAMFGVSGVPWGTVLGFGGIYCLFGIHLAYRSIDKAERNDALPT